MTVYQITNKVNNRKYIGITNNPKKRWSNHCCNKKSPIGRAIQKYGKGNFLFEVLLTGLSIEEAEEKEIELIQKEKSLCSQWGYNIARGGRYNIWPGQNRGEKNPNHILTIDEVIDIKSRRYLPMYVLFEDYSDRISYQTFKQIYNDQSWNEVKTEVEPYPFNLEFSCQFINTSLDYADIIKMRELYQKGLTPQEAYKDFSNKISFQSFGNAYRGDTFSLIMPEVFSDSNKHFILSKAHSGEKNGRSKLTKEDVITIRQLFEEEEKSLQELYQLYPQVTPTSIRNIINYKTWKNI